MIPWTVLMIDPGPGGVSDMFCVCTGPGAAVIQIRIGVTIGKAGVFFFLAWVVPETNA